MAFKWARVPILPRLITRFSLRDIPEKPGEEFLFPQVVHAVSNVDPLLVSTKIIPTTTAIAATGWQIACTLGGQKRWRLYAYQFALQSGVFVFSDMALFDGTNRIAVDIFGAVAARQLVFPGGPLPLDKNWQIQLYCSSFTTQGDNLFTVLVDEEDAY